MDSTLSTGGMFKYSKHTGNTEQLDSYMTNCRLQLHLLVSTYITCANWSCFFMKKTNFLEWFTEITLIIISQKLSHKFINLIN